MTIKGLAKQALFRPHGDMKWVRFTENGEPMRLLVHDDTVWNMVREMILTRIYERPGWFTFADHKGTVIDAGANVGFFSLIASRYSEEVIAIEAEPVNAKIVELNAAANRATNVQVLNRALWSSDETLYFSATGQSGSGVVGQTGSSDPVQGITLAEVLERSPDATMLKVDIEGAEFEAVLACADFGQLTTIVGELHQPKNSPQVAALVAHLERAGFEIDIPDETYFYSQDMLARARENRAKVQGQSLIKAMVGPYFAVGAKLPTAHELPGLFARR